MAKKAYRVRNWNNYNKSLVARGRLTFWFSKDVINDWSIKETNKAHGNQKYSDMVILCCLTLRQLYRITLRSTEGLVQSLLDLMDLDLPTPNYSTLSRRGKQLEVDLCIKTTNQPLHVLIDSTGIQVMSEGQWKKLHYGESHHQVWRKLHVAIDADTQTILSATMTDSVCSDAVYLPKLLDDIQQPIHQVTCDAAYDKKNCYHAIHKRKAKAVIPPCRNAIVQKNKYKKDPALLQRDAAVTFINNDEEQRKLWKINNNYHCRSLVETLMFRMKTIFGDQLRSRHFDNQVTDLRIRCHVINRINSLGMPQSEAIN